MKASVSLLETETVTLPPQRQHQATPCCETHTSLACSHPRVFLVGFFLHWPWMFLRTQLHALFSFIFSLRPVLLKRCNLNQWGKLLKCRLWLGRSEVHWDCSFLRNSQVTPMLLVPSPHFTSKFHSKSWAKITHKGYDSFFKNWGISEYHDSFFLKINHKSRLL